jgi:hypothetical protein
MLHGFSVPLTPQGKSALASPPPWHYSSDCLAIEYWADPAAIAALIRNGRSADYKREMLKRLSICGATSLRRTIGGLRWPMLRTE